MRKLNEAATRTFLTLIDGLAVGESRKVDNAPGTFMAVSVECLAESRAAAGSQRGTIYAVAHHYEANGDLVPDPDVELYVIDDADEPGTKAVYPTAIDHGPMGYHRHVEFDGAGNVSRFARRGQSDLARFCDLWMRSIAAQQRLSKPRS